MQEVQWGAVVEYSTAQYSLLRYTVCSIIGGHVIICVTVTVNGPFASNSTPKSLAAVCLETQELCVLNMEFVC